MVIGGIIWVIVVLVRRRKGGEEFPDPAIGTLNRVYYGLSFVVPMVTASGVILLLDYVAAGLFGPRVLSDGDAKLALGLALTLVGAPIWFSHWRLADRAIHQFPTEAQVFARQVYLLVLAVLAALAANKLVELLRWMPGAEKFDGLHLAFPLVWGGIWAFHWRLESRSDNFQAPDKGSFYRLVP